MRRNAVLEKFLWELSSISRFPVMEILAGFFTFMTMLYLPYLSASRSAAIGLLLKSHFDKYWLHETITETLLIKTFIAILLFTSVLASTVFTRNFEMGYARDELSLPIGRESLFLVKFLSLFLVLLASILSAILASLMFMDPVGGLVVMFSPRILVILLAVSTAIIVPLSISVLFSVLSRNTLLSVVSSFIFMMGLYTVLPYVNLSFLISPQSLILRSWSVEDLPIILTFLSIRWGASLAILGCALIYYKRVEL